VDLTITNCRLFDYPSEKIYSAFADPERLARWWGPHGFTNTFVEFDFRPGGAWRFTMHGPEGQPFHNISTFIDIRPNERIVLEHLEPMHRFLLTVTLARKGEKTELTWHMKFDKPFEPPELREFIAAANEQNFDRLEEELSRPATTS
jgi:uncharacterized protein YndB with AHSA1/START domain